MSCRCGWSRSRAISPRCAAANYWISSERPALERLLARIDLLIINDEELRQLAEDHNIKRGAARVLKMGPKRLIVKRAQRGTAPRPVPAGSMVHWGTRAVREVPVRLYREDWNL